MWEAEANIEQLLDGQLQILDIDRSRGSTSWRSGLHMTRCWHTSTKWDDSG